MKNVTFAALVTACSLLPACHSPDMPLAENFGESVKHNMAMHIINPSGQHVTEIPGNDAERTLRAHDRMVKEKAQPAPEIPAFVIQAK